MMTAHGGARAADSRGPTDSGGAGGGGARGGDGEPMSLGNGEDLEHQGGAECSGDRDGGGGGGAGVTED